MTLRLRRISFIAGLLFLAHGFSARPHAAHAAPATTRAGAKTAPQKPSERTPEQLLADAPPPTAYDIDPGQAPAKPAPVLGSTAAMLAQLWRTVMALGLVVGLILLSSKYILPKMLGKVITPTSKHIKVLERTVVDGRNALVLVEIGAGSRLLLGSSETGLRLVAHVATPAATTFESSMGPTGTLLPSQGSRDAQTN